MKGEEHSEQAALIQYAEYMARKDPSWAMLFAIPNGGKRHPATARRMKEEGQKAGVPDLCLPIPRGCYHGLFLELKTKTGKPTENQEHWLDALEKEGYCARVCYGWQAARETLERYLALRPESELR